MESDRPPQAELADETDADLLVYMALAADDAAVAAAAWQELYRRHARYLYAVCLRAYGNLLGGPAGVGDLVADTFGRAYEHAERFDAGGIVEAERLRRRVRAWLGRIAHRLVQTVLRGRSRVRCVLLDQDQWQQVAERGEPAAADPERTEPVRRAIESLSEREQVVIRVTFQWYQPDRAHQRLPNDVAAELAGFLQTTPENLRQIRHRALKKIEASLRSEGNAERKRR